MRERVLSYQFLDLHVTFLLPKITEALIKQGSAILIIIVVVIVVVIIIVIVVIVVIVVVDVDENISQGVSSDQHHADVTDGGHGTAMLHRPGQASRGVVDCDQLCHHWHHSAVSSQDNETTMIQVTAQVELP